MDGYGVPALWITCARMVIAAACFLFMTAVRDWRSLIAVFRDVRSVVQIAAFALFGILLTQVSYLTTIGYTNAATGTALEQVGLVLIMLYVCVRARRLPRVREVAGLLCALAGMFAFATQGDLGSLAIPPEGFAWGLLSAVALAFYTLLPVRVLGKWGSLLVTGLAMLFGGAAATVAVQPWAMPVQLSGGALVAIVAIVLVGTLGAYMLYLQGVADAGPVKASLLCSIEPVAALVISALWLQAPVSAWDVAGCVAIVAMVVLVTEREEAPADAAAGVVSGEPDPPLFAGRASELGYYADRPATREDFAQVSRLLEEGRQAIAALGIDEGPKKYPSSRRLMRSIKDGTCHVVEDARGNPLAVFAVSFSPDKNYARGIEGAWLTETDACPQPYAELHWVAVDEDARHRAWACSCSTAPSASHAPATARRCAPTCTSATFPCRGCWRSTATSGAAPSRSATCSAARSGGSPTSDCSARRRQLIGEGDSETWIFARLANRTSTSSMGILADGRAALQALGIDQWQGGYPHRAVVEADVTRGESYVAKDGDLAVATMMVGFSGERIYDFITAGAWLTDSSSADPGYGVVHRVAVALAHRGRGAASFLLEQAESLTWQEGLASVRIDTHPGNAPMRRLLLKRGYAECGTVYIDHAEGATPDRVAYEKLLR